VRTEYIRERPEYGCGFPWIRVIWEHVSQYDGVEGRSLLTNGLLRIRWRRPSRNGDGWFGPDGS